MIFCDARFSGMPSRVVALYARYGGDTLGTPASDITFPEGSPRRATLFDGSGGPQEKDRDLLIKVTADPNGYVQCRLEDNETPILCEAASGFSLDKLGAPRTHFCPTVTVQAVAALGFPTNDTRGNFQRMSNITGDADYVAIADLMLTALYRGYGPGWIHRSASRRPMTAWIRSPPEGGWLRPGQLA